MNDPVKMRVQTKASKMGLARCSASHDSKLIVAQPRPGHQFAVREEGVTHYLPILRSLSWARMEQMLDEAEIVQNP